MLSPTNLDNFFITKIRFELGSIIKGFFSIKSIRLDFFLLIKFKRLILPIYLFSFETIYPSVLFCFVSNLIAFSIDVDGLKETVANMNKYAETGVDEEFGRGSYEYDRYYGDQSITPNPCLAAINQAPFYALKQDPGDFGTHGGVACASGVKLKRTSSHSRVVIGSGV